MLICLWNSCATLTNQISQVRPPRTRLQTQHRLKGSAVATMDFVIWTRFVIWALAFELCLSFASLRYSAGLCTAHKHKGQTLTKRILRTLTIESAAGGRHTYEEELLNSEKNSRFYKTNTNHSGFSAAVAHATSVKWDILER
jgi:hypothetical protein